MVKHPGKQSKEDRPAVMETNSKRRSSSSHGKALKETCAICFEKTDINHMLSLHDCAHKRCVSCVKKHLQVKLHEGTALPTCPQKGCKSSIKIRNCKKVLKPELVKLVKQRLKESQIPVRERIYCPYPKCSYLMSKAEVLAQSKGRKGKNADESGYRKCLKCGGKFCVQCKVPWHYDMTCYDYKKYKYGDLSLSILELTKMCCLFSLEKLSVFLCLVKQ